MPEQKHIRFCLDKSYAFFHLLYGDIFHIRFLPVSTYIIYTFFDLSSSPAFPKDKGTQYLILKNRDRHKDEKTGGHKT